MAKYLISFPSAAMVVPDGEWEAVGRDAHAVIDEAKAAGVYVFAGGIDENVPPVLVSADGAVAKGGYPWAPSLDGGFTVLELPSPEEAVAWAARIAKACRCDQELRVFQFDPQSRGPGARERELRRRAEIAKVEVGSAFEAESKQPLQADVYPCIMRTIRICVGGMGTMAASTASAVGHVLPDAA